MIARSRSIRILVGAAFLVIGLATTATRASAQPTGDTVIRLSLDGVVDPFMADYLRTEIEDGDGAAAILITIDTPGGLDSSMREIVQAIQASPTPVLGYVSPSGARAASAGAFILMATHIAAMAPATNVGASTPVGIGGVTLSEKVEQDAAAYMRGLAEQRGRNAELASTFVTESKSISAEEALEENVIDLIAPSEEALLDEVDGMVVATSEGNEVTLATEGASITEVDMSPGVGFLHRLFDPNLAFIFFWLGLALIVLELIVPGHIFSGTLGTILLILAVVSFGLLPVRLIGIAFLVASIVFFVIELKVPGIGIWSVAGILSLIAGGLFLFDSSGGAKVSPVVIVVVALCMAAFFGFVVAKALAMRHLPPAQGPEAVVGREGVVLAGGLNPEGVVRVAAEEWKATTSSGSVAEGAKIRVTRLDGLVLTVEPLDTEHAPTGDASPAKELTESGGTS